jgi:hypothetical protein
MVRPFLSHNKARLLRKLTIVGNRSFVGGDGATLAWQSLSGPVFFWRRAMNKALIAQRKNGDGNNRVVTWRSASGRLDTALWAVAFE